MAEAMLKAPGMKLMPGTKAESKRQRLGVTVTQLKNARQSFESHWKEIAELFRPRRIRLQSSDRNKGDKRNQKIVDSTPMLAAQTLAAGMMSGITSPARQWFKLTVADQALMENQAVKVWLEEVREAMSEVLTSSNFYEVLSPYYSDLGVFGTSAMIIEEDDETVIRCTHFALGEYWIGYNSRQQVRVFMREYDLTVRQVVEQFGIKEDDGYSTKNLSDTVVNAWNGGQTEQGITVTHVIYENPDHDADRIEARHKPFASCYFESAGAHDKFLDEGGYDEWPVMVVRWEVTGGDVYGTDCPGMRTLGDAKELMFAVKLNASALNKAVNPPLKASGHLMNSPVNLLPGGITYVPNASDVSHSVEPLIDTRSINLSWAKEHIQDLRDMCDRGFHVDLFRLIANIEKANTTATEILEKKEEKLIILGPVGKQVDGGFLDPCMARVFGRMLNKGRIPEPPPELRGVEWNPEYESIMATAQRAQGRTNIDAFMIFVQAIAKDDPTKLDRVDVDEVIKAYSEATGTSPKFIRSDEATAAIAKARADAAAKQQAAEQASMAADAANKLAGADLSTPNALTALMGAENGLGPTSPAGGF